MRRNSVRKFIHALVDLIPLFIIPIFAININQKSVEPISIEVQENIKVENFNQRFKFNDSQYFTIENSYTISLDNVTIPTYYSMPNGSVTNNSDKFLLTYEITNTNSGTFYTYMDYNNLINGFYQYQLNQVQQLIVGFSERNFSFNVATNNTFNGTVKYNLVNLTAMFGDDLPTIAEFNLLFPNYFYDYVLTETVMVEGYTTTYDDTDIGSQFLYSLYKPINDYFNFNNLFNMNDVWNWIQLNLFQGTAPLPVFMIWNIMIYEFFVDLLFLLYAVFMFIIDWSTGLIDKFLGRSRT